jgi:hypothetical protein
MKSVTTMACGIVRGAGVLFLMLALSACASISGPYPVVNAKKAQAANEAYINGDVLGAFYGADANKRNGLTPLQWRNTVVGAQLDAADQNYAAYVSGLRSEHNSFALAADLIGIGLSEGASVAGKATANALSAASAGILSANTAINKEAFYNATIEALISQMDAERATVRAEIQKGMQNSETAYPLESALGDVRRYEAAGTIDRAITKVNAIASAAKVAAEANLDLVRGTPFVEAKDTAAELLGRIVGLNDAQALALLSAMKPKIVERSAALQQNIKALVPGLDKISDGATAKKALQTWIVLDDRTPDFQKEWSDALDAASK